MSLQRALLPDSLRKLHPCGTGDTGPSPVAPPWPHVSYCCKKTDGYCTLRPCPPSRWLPMLSPRGFKHTDFCNHIHIHHIFPVETERSEQALRCGEPAVTRPLCLQQASCLKARPWASSGTAGRVMASTPHPPPPFKSAWALAVQGWIPVVLPVVSYLESV